MQIAKIGTKFAHTLNKFSPLLLRLKKLRYEV